MSSLPNCSPMLLVPIVRSESGAFSVRPALSNPAGYWTTSDTLTRSIDDVCRSLGGQQRADRESDDQALDGAVGQRQLREIPPRDVAACLVGPTTQGPGDESSRRGRRRSCHRRRHRSSRTAGRPSPWPNCLRRRNGAVIRPPVIGKRLLIIFSDPWTCW